MSHITQVFNMIAALGVKADPSRCVFGAQEVPYLGHMLSSKGVGPMEPRIKMSCGAAPAYSIMLQPMYEQQANNKVSNLMPTPLRFK